MSTNLSLNFNAFFYKIVTQFWLNLYRIISQLVQNCQANYTKLSLKLHNIVTDTSFVSVCWRHRGISHHSLSGWGGGVSNTTATWVWPLKGVLSANTTEQRRVCSTITWGPFTHSFIQWLSRDSWAFRLFQPIPMVWVVISPCVINYANYTVV